jgi:hypothetical protein
LQHQIPESAQGGALFYFVHTQLIETDAGQAVIILTEKLEKFLLKTLSGENIFTACSLIQGVIGCFKELSTVSRP